MNPTVRSLCAAAVAALLLVSCSPAEAEPYSSTSDLAEGLGAAGVSCESLKEGPAADLVEESATCRTEDGELNLFVFRSSAKRDDWKRLGARVLPTALGPNWAVSGERAQIQKISDEMNTTVVLP